MEFVAGLNQVMMPIYVRTVARIPDMHLLFKRFFSICLLRAAPQDLPASRFLLVLALLSYSLVKILLVINHATFISAVAMSVVDVILLSGFCWSLLWVRLLSLRYTQTLTALAGCSAIVALCAWPLLLWQQYYDDDTGIRFVSLIVALIISLWFLWKIIVFSHIISQALSSPLFIGVLLTIIYIYISFSVSQALFYQEAV